MNRSLFAAASVAACFLGSSAAGAADLPVSPPQPAATFAPDLDPHRIWYAGLFGGASLPHDLETVLQPFGNNIEIDLDAGWTIGVMVGRYVTDRFHADLELSYARHEASSYLANGLGPTVASGPVETGYLLLNGWYDFNDGNFIPYAGAGVGLGMHRSDVHLDVGMFGPGGDDVGLAFQFGAGARYGLTDRLDIDLGYRFKGLLGVDFPDRSGANEVYTDGDLYSHNLQIGLTYKFGR